MTTETLLNYFVGILDTVANFGNTVINFFFSDLATFPVLGPFLTFIGLGSISLLEFMLGGSIVTFFTITLIKWAT